MNFEPEEPFCFYCRHYLGKYKCLAFPEGIPDAIVMREALHGAIREGQEGQYIFEPKNPDDAEQHHLAEEAEGTVI